MCPPSDRRPWTSVTCRPATIPTHSTMYTLCPRPTPAPGRTPVRNTRMSGGWAPADLLLHTPIALFPTPPPSLCNCTARACLPVSPRGGILHSGPNPGKQNLYSPPWHTLSRLGRRSTDRMCLDRAIGCGGGTAPRTSPYCRSLCQSGNS